MPLVKLTGIQRRTLREALLQCYPGDDELSMLVQDLDRSLPEISTGGNLTLMVNATISIAEGQGWLLDLLRMAEHDNPREDRFPELLKTLQSHVPAALLDPFGACRLGGDQVMVDRDTLRDAIRNMATPLGKRILLVDGLPKSGKTHAQFLVTYLRQALGQFEVVLVDLERYACVVGGEIQAEHLGERIAAQMKMPVPPSPEDHQRARWVLRFCDDLQAWAMAEPRQWWILIDHFNKVLLPQSAIDLVKELAIRISTTLAGYRMILISYGEEFSPELGVFVARDATTPIKSEDLAAFFHRASEQWGMTPDADKVAQAVAKVLQSVDLSHVDSFTALGPAVAKTTTELLSGTL